MCLSISCTASKIFKPPMPIRSISLFAALCLLASSATAQNVQTNNHGVIVNVLATPVYSQPLNLPEVRGYSEADGQRDFQQYLNNGKFELDKAELRRAANPQAAGTASSFYYPARTRVQVVLRLAPDTKSLRLASIPSHSVITVDRRGGEIPNGWSAVSYYETESFGYGTESGTVSGYIQTKYILE